MPKIVVDTIIFNNFAASCFYNGIPMRIEDEIKQKAFRTEAQKAIINIMFTAGWLRNKVNGQLRKYDLTPEQFNVLRILNGQYPHCISLKNITERMIDKNSNTSRIVDKLLDKGLVSRATDEKDRRGCSIGITGTGLDLLKTIDAAWPKDEGFKTLSDDDLKKLNSLLDNLRDE